MMSNESWRVAIEYDELHQGSYYLSTDPTKVEPFAFRLHVATPGVREFVRARSAHATGTLHAKGLAETAEIAGLVTWKRVERRIAYSLEFQADDGRAIAFVGEKDLHPTLGLRALSQLHGSLFHLPAPGVQWCQSADREEIGRAHVGFDLRRDLWPMLRSTRLIVPGFSLGLSR